MSQNESCPCGCLFVLCVFFLLDEHVEGDVYGFGVEDVEITKVAKKAGITEVAEMAEIYKCKLEHNAPLSDSFSLI